MPEPEITPLSHSRCEMADGCLYRFKRVAIDKVRKPKPLPMAVGNLIHHWAEVYIKHLVQTAQKSDYAAADSIFHTLWTTRATNPDYAMLPESMHDAMFDMVQKFCESHAFDTEQILGAEIEIALTRDWRPTTWMADDVFFRAKIDLLMGYRDEEGRRVVRVRDWKTNMAVDSLEDVKQSPQLRRYIMVCNALDAARDDRDSPRALDPIDRYEICLDFVRYQVQREVTMSPAVGEAEKERVLAISDKVEAAKASQQWPATPGEGCGFCEVFDECPAKKIAVSLRPPQTEAEARLLLARLVTLEKEGKEVKDLLKSYGSEYGAVVSNGMQFGPSKRTEIGYDVKALFEWADTYGIDRAAVVKNVGQDDMYDAIRLVEKDRQAEARAALALLAIDRSGTEFRLRKAQVAK